MSSASAKSPTQSSSTDTSANRIRTRTGSDSSASSDPSRSAAPAERTAARARSTPAASTGWACVAGATFACSHERTTLQMLIRQGGDARHLLASSAGLERPAPGGESADYRQGADESACKPDPVHRASSRPARATAIPLGLTSPPGSSGLPAGSGGPPSNACTVAGFPGSLLTLLPVGFAEPPRSPGVLVVSYTAVSPLPRRSAEAVCFLWHFPAGRPGLPLATTVPCGVRTFLGGGLAPADAAARPARPPSISVRAST
jgi:hypothetical protein